MIKTKDNPIYNLQPNPNNPRTISTEAFTRLKEKIQRNPDGLTANKIVHKDGIIVAGNQRWRAINELKLELQPEWFKDVTDWTDEQIREYLVTSNVSDGAWDWDLLADQYEALELAEWGIDVPDWDEDKDIVEDESPAIDEGGAAVSVPGTVYQLGRHRVMCGDSTNIEQFETLVGAARATLVFTDPPYGVNYQSNMRVKTQKFDVLNGDSLITIDGVVTASEYSEGWIMVCTSWKVLKEWLVELEVFGNPSNIIIWDKGGGGIGDLKHTLITDYEVIIAYNRGAKIIGKRIGSVWDCGKDASSKYEHPTQKPVSLPALAINTMTSLGDVVFDVYLGSGSTLMACEQTDRTCYGMELDPRYVDVVRKRYAKYANGGVLPENWQELTPTIG